MRCTIVEKETFCIYFSLKYFRKNIFGIQNTVYTENGNNSYLNRPLHHESPDGNFCK